MSVFDEGAVPFSAIPPREIPGNQGYRFANRCFLTGHGNFSDSLLDWASLEAHEGIYSASELAAMHERLQLLAEAFEKIQQAHG